jgi:integrase
MAGSAFGAWWPKLASAVSGCGNRLSPTGFETAFTAASVLAGLDHGKRLRPHDLRHRFAVTRLVLWHQEKADGKRSSDALV